MRVRPPGPHTAAWVEERGGGERGVACVWEGVRQVERGAKRGREAGREGGRKEASQPPSRAHPEQVQQACDVPLSLHQLLGHAVTLEERHLRQRLGTQGWVGGWSWWWGGDGGWWGGGDGGWGGGGVGWGGKGEAQEQASTHTPPNPSHPPSHPTHTNLRDGSQVGQLWLWKLHGTTGPGVVRPRPQLCTTRRGAGVRVGGGTRGGSAAAWRV